MIGPGIIVDGLGKETHYVLLGKIGKRGGQLAAPINAIPETPKVVELVDGFYQTNQAAVLAKFGATVAKIRQRYKLPQTPA